jgi:outer membrane lipoprotein carrier protein
MKRRTFTLSLLGFALPLVAASSRAQQAKQPPAAATPTLPALSANDIVTNVDQVYNRMSTFKASFKQRYVAPAYGKTVDSAGSVIFEKPGKMSWSYASGNRVVSNGNVLKIYEKDNKQMFVQPLHSSQYPAALSFLTGQGNLKKDFTFTLQNSAQMKFPSGYVLLGQPRQPTAAYDKVYFYVDAQTFQVRRVIIQDVQQNRNRFDFANPLVNTKTPPGAFAFTPPRGTQVIQP